jgi:hypothetical protein
LLVSRNLRFCEPRQRGSGEHTLHSSKFSVSCQEHELLWILACTRESVYAGNCTEVIKNAQRVLHMSPADAVRYGFDPAPSDYDKTKYAAQGSSHPVWIKKIERLKAKLRTG